MGRGAESNVGRPELRIHAGVPLLFPSWGSERVAGIGFGHVAAARPTPMQPGEGVTVTQWLAITSAAVQGVGPMETAIAATPLATAYTRAKSRAAANGILDLPQRTRDTYAAWDGASLTSPWVTA